MDNNTIYIKDTDRTGFMPEVTYGNVFYFHLNGKHGIILSVGEPDNSGGHEKMIIRKDNITV